MPKFQRETAKIAGKNNPPKIFGQLKPTLDKIQAELDALSQTISKNKSSRQEVNQSITRLNAQKSRYLFNLYHKRNAIDKDSWLWLCKWGYVDTQLASKWKKKGYERVCCLDCIEGTVCVCRVPKSVRISESAHPEDGKTAENGQEKSHASPDVAEFPGCTRCGCEGCASGD